MEKFWWSAKWIIMVKITETVFQILLELLLITKIYEYLNLWYSMGIRFSHGHMYIIFSKKNVLLEELFWIRLVLSFCKIEFAQKFFLKNMAFIFQTPWWPAIKVRNWGPSGKKSTNYSMYLVYLHCTWKDKMFFFLAG